MCVCVCVCVYNFYLNKLFKSFILLKEIIMIVKTHIKLILNMLIYSLNFIGERERESTCDGELKNTTLKRISPR